MINPARKPTGTQQARPVVKPANTRSLPKRRLVPETYPEIYSFHIFPFQ